MSPKPGLFLVGAPRCGTTAMTEFLSAHPQIFMAPVKEVHYFGRDLHFTQARPTGEQYLSLFDGVRDELCVGESSVWYLYSRTAAHEIQEFNPLASVVIMLRNPVEMLYSLHSEFLFGGNEDIADFAGALDAEVDRREGRRVPSTVNFPVGLLYRTTIRYRSQVARYFDTFGEERVLVILFDDFVADTAAVYRQTLEHLGVDANFRPVFGAANGNRRVRNTFVRDMVAKPRGVPRLLAKALVPPSLRRRAADVAWKLVAESVPRPPMDLALRTRLTEEFKEEIQGLELLIGRDLSGWYGTYQEHSHG